MKFRNCVVNVIFSHFGSLTSSVFKLVDQSYSDRNSSIGIATPTTEEEISKLISSLNNSAAGWDSLQTNDMKLTKDSIQWPLTYLSNLSLTSGVFPTEPKIANVVFKASNDMVFTNYRPVSVLPIMSKIFERLMYTRQLDFLTKKNILYEFQFGFRNKYSADMALITLVDRISSALDRGESVIGIF